MSGPFFLNLHKFFLADANTAFYVLVVGTMSAQESASRLDIHDS